MKIYSIFSSINGEANCRGQGTWVTFVRLAGCSLGCSYCDTKYAQDSEFSQEYTVKRVMEMIDSYGIPYVLITGGEPFEQRKELAYIVLTLKTRGFHVTIETNGTHELLDRGLYEVDCYVLDYKLPSAGVEKEFNMYNIEHLTRHDFIKFVIYEPFDYDKAKVKYRRLMHINNRPNFAFSPVLNKVDASSLYSWMAMDKLWNVQLSLQLHKIVRLPEPR